MKNLLLILFLFVSATLYAQDYPDAGLDRVRIVEADKIIQAEIKPVNTNLHVKTDRFYFWYSANAVHSSEGGYSGDLLNGLYNEYYLNKNLKAQGVFKKGLKDGVWKSWNADGTLISVTTWKDGIIVPSNSPSLLEKVNIFRKKNKQIVSDSSVKPHS